MKSYGQTWKPSYGHWDTIPPTFSPGLSAPDGSSSGSWYATPTVRSVWTNSVPPHRRYTTPYTTTRPRPLAVLWLERDYDSHWYWWDGAERARDSGQEVQPLFMLKDDSARCEADESAYCECQSAQYRYDWRPGREMSDADTLEWARGDQSPHAHGLTWKVPTSDGEPDLQPAGADIPTDIIADLLGRLPGGTITITGWFE